MAPAECSVMGWWHLQWRPWVDNNSNGNTCTCWAGRTCVKQYLWAPPPPHVVHAGRQPLWLSQAHPLLLGGLGLLQRDHKGDRIITGETVSLKIQIGSHSLNKYFLRASLCYIGAAVGAKAAAPTDAVGKGPHQGRVSLQEGLG